MSELKKYTAGCDVSFNIRYGEGTKRIVFDSMSSGKSMYVTLDENEQQGIESHPDFGRLFFLAETVSKDAGAKKEDEAAVVEAEKAVKQVKISDPEDAKEYLAMNYDIPRSNLKTLKKIKETAAQVGVEFVGL